MSRSEIRDIIAANEEMNTRQQAILEIVQDSGRVSVRELARQFVVSEMTIRRDLTALEAAGRLVRTHGGGLVVGHADFLQRAFPSAAVSPRKQAIGRAAAALVQPGQTVMVDTGTTALEVARHLPRDASITVATTSLCVAEELYGEPLNVLLLGGFMRKEFPSLYGPITESLLRTLHVDILFIGCDGANSEDGFYTADLHVSSLEQAMMRISDRVVVVTESGKFGKRAFARYARPEEIHTLVTDDGLAEKDRKNLEERGVTVVLVD